MAEELNFPISTWEQRKIEEFAALAGQSLDDFQVGDQIEFLNLNPAIREEIFGIVTGKDAMAGFLEVIFSPDDLDSVLVDPCHAKNLSAHFRILQDKLK